MNFPEMDTLLTSCQRLARQAKSAAITLASAPTAAKDRWLRRVADWLIRQQETIFVANAQDLALAADSQLSAASMDRLRLTPERLRGSALALTEIATLPDPVGQVRDATRRPNGLQVFRVGVPLGVILFIYESRPNVTLDAAALCVKSGNAVILRGGKEAIHSNLALHRILTSALVEEGLPQEAVQLVETTDRAAVGHLLQMSDCIDLAIPRGGEELIRRVSAEASMPVLKHYKGICHVFVEKSADLDRAEAIIVNAKCQRPGVCNAAECLIVDRAVAAAFLPRVAASLTAKGVELRGCPETCRLIPGTRAATPEDYQTEYLDLKLSVKVVNGLEEAVSHIRQFGSGHTEALVCNDHSVIQRFVSLVDSAAVIINASTRFHDGGELGLGAEIGISTDKIHARGPCGLLELTSYKYVVYGDGQVRG